MGIVENQAIIDIDMLVDILRGVEKTVKFITELEEKDFVLSTTVINAYELYYGAYKSEKKLKDLKATRKLLERMPILKMGFKSAEKAGWIQAKLESEGQPIGTRDIMISAIAITKGYALATRNVEHLYRIKGLNLIAVPRAREKC